MRQNAKKQGSIAAREILKKHPEKSTKDFEDIEFLEDDEILSGVASLFLQIPNEYASMVGMIGKKYEAIKDFCKWHGYSQKKFTPILIHMGEVWAKEVESNGKNISSKN